MKHQTKLYITKLMFNGALFTVVSMFILTMALILGDAVSGLEIADNISGGSGG